MLSEEVKRYEALTGESSVGVPISRLGGYLDGYEQGREDAINRVLDILHNHYEVRNAEQNAFMDRLCMLVIKMKGADE